MDTLPSHKSHEEVLSVTQNLINHSTHCPSAHDAVQDDLSADALTDCPTFMPGGLSLAAITASANTRSMNTVAQVAHDPNSSSDDLDQESEPSFRLGGPRHICEIFPIDKGETSEDEGRKVMPAENAQDSRLSSDAQLEEQPDRGAVCDNDQQPSSNDCEATPTAQEQATNLARDCVRKMDGEGMLQALGKQAYVEELLHLRGVVETLRRHLDLMIANTTTSVSADIGRQNDENGSSENHKL